MIDRKRCIHHEVCGAESCNTPISECVKYNVAPPNWNEPLVTYTTSASAAIDVRIIDSREADNVM